MSDYLALTGEVACDGCVMLAVPCPGQDAHCARGEHCTATDAACAMDLGNDDHPTTCEHCGQPLKVQG